MCKTLVPQNFELYNIQVTKCDWVSENQPRQQNLPRFLICVDMTNSPRLCGENENYSTSVEYHGKSCEAYRMRLSPSEQGILMNMDRTWLIFGELVTHYHHQLTLTAKAITTAARHTIMT